MTSRQLFIVSVRILGMYLLVESIMQIPAGFVYGVYFLMNWTRFWHENTFTAPMMHQSLYIVILSFLLYAATGCYLVTGALHLLKILRINDPGEKNP